MGASPRVSSRLVFGGCLGVGSCRWYAAARVSCAFRVRASAFSRCLHDVVSSVVLRCVVCLLYRHRAIGGSGVEAVLRSESCDRGGGGGVRESRVASVWRDRVRPV